MATSSTSSSANTRSPEPSESLFRRVFRAFHYRDFRVMWMGACTSSIGTWMQMLAQAWVVYDITGSSFYLGLDAFLAQMPIMLFSLIGGVVADRMSRRKLLLMSQFVQMGCAFTLALVIGFGYHHIWPILCMSFVTGSAQSFGGPAYSALIPTLVDSADLPNAIALNSIQFNLARVIGPMIGGIALKDLGASWCFGLNGVSFIAVIATLFMIQSPFQPQHTGESVIASMKTGFAFIRGRDAMVALIVLAFLMTVIGYPMIVFLPVFARQVFHGGSNIYTLLLCSSGAGSVCGALIVAAMGRSKNLGRSALVMLLAFGVSMISFSQSTHLVWSCIFLFLAGASLISVFAMVSSLVQLITADNMRGRVMSVYNVAFRGGMPIGSLSNGALIPIFTAPLVLGVNGGLLIAVGLYFLFVHRRIANL
jgi:predicted MFS family arabinose efflux permease